MARNLPTTAYLILEMTYPSVAGEAPLPRSVIDYHERLEDRFMSLADGRRVREGVSSAEEATVRGSEWWTETMSLAAASAEDLEPLAARVVRMVRRLGIRHGHRFTLRMRAADGNGEWTEWFRRLYPTRDTVWQQKGVATWLHPRAGGATPFPDRLAYLAGWARRCMGVGGDDVYALFERPSDLHAFLAGLGRQDRAGLTAIYGRIVRRKDNEWLLGWLRSNDASPDGPPEWAVQAHWLMLLLDRLREAGVFDQPNRRAKYTELVFWDDYLEGEPDRKT